jgi:hypothetical protein
MRKKFLILTILFSAAVLSACNKPAVKPAVSEPAAVLETVAETGRVVDLTTLAGQTATVTPGDVLYDKFRYNDKNREYSIGSANAGDYLSLKDQKMSTDQATKETVVERWFKVEKVGQFDLIFNYGLPLKKADKVFEYKIISQ